MHTFLTSYRLLQMADFGNYRCNEENVKVQICMALGWDHITMLVELITADTVLHMFYVGPCWVFMSTLTGPFTQKESVTQPENGKAGVRPLFAQPQAPSLPQGTFLGAWELGKASLVLVLVTLCSLSFQRQL